jgi:hypothetical protein
MIGVDDSAVWFPLIVVLGVSIASITLGSLNIQKWWGQVMLWIGIAELILSIIITLFVFGNNIF